MFDERYVIVTRTMPYMFEADNRYEFYSEGDFTELPSDAYKWIAEIDAINHFNKCGYSIDEPDMLLDEQSFKAIYQFQKDSGLYPYGVLDFTTQQALNNKLEQLISQHDKQLAKAYELLKE